MLSFWTGVQLSTPRVVKFWFRRRSPEMRKVYPWLLHSCSTFQNMLAETLQSLHSVMPLRAHAPDWRPAAPPSGSIGIRPLLFVSLQTARRAEAASARWLFGLFLCLRGRKAKKKTCHCYFSVTTAARSAGTPGGKTNRKRKVDCRHLCVWLVKFFFILFFLRFVVVVVVLVVLNAASYLEADHCSKLHLLTHFE